MYTVERSMEKDNEKVRAPKEERRQYLKRWHGDSFGIIQVGRDWAVVERDESGRRVRGEQIE